MKRKNGFTLIELLVVIAIIAILAAVIFPIMGKQIKKAKDAKAVAAVGAVRTAVTTATADLEGYAPKISGSGATNNVLYNLIYGTTVYSSAGGTPSVASITADGIDTKSRALFSEFGLDTASVTAGTPSTIGITYAIATGSGSATITFGSSNNSSNVSWSTL